MAETLTVCNEITKELEDCVGKAGVLTDEKTLDAYSRDESWEEPRRPDWVVRTGSTDQVQKVVQLANKHKVPVVPRSSGVGLHGSGIPAEGGIILDMQSMNRLLRVDTRNKWAMVEPGVTYGQLQKELEPHGFRAVTPLLPHPRKSVISSLLEKNPHLSSKMHLDEVILTMQIIFPNGDRFRTGSLAVPVPNLKPEEVPDKANSGLCNSLGPGIDWWRLLTGSEGCFGAVTVMNFKIVPRPAMQKVYFLPAPTLEQLIDPAYRILRREIGNECFIMNRLDLASMLAEDDNELAALREKLPAFCLVLCLDAGEWYPQEKIAYQEHALDDVCQQGTCSVTSALPVIGEADKRVARLLTRSGDNGVYWKFRLKGGCWDLMLLTPLDKAPRWISTVRQMAAECGYPADDVGIYLQPKQRGRAYHLEFSFPLDRGNAGECRKVKELIHQAAQRLLSEGAFLYRPYGSLAEMVFSRTGSLRESIKKIKGILDPSNVMNPGRLAL